MRSLIRAAVLSASCVLTACSPGNSSETGPAVSSSTSTTSTSSTSSEAPATDSSSPVTSSTSLPSTTSTSTPPTTVPPSTTPPAPSRALAPEGKRTNWEGVIDGDIGFTLSLAQQGLHLRGELAYDSVGEPITILGTRLADSDFYVLHEFDPNGRVTGTLSFTYPGDGSIPDGHWDDLSLTMRFVGIDPQGNVFDPLVRPGTYGYQFKPYGDDEDCCGAAGRMSLSHVIADSVTVEFENHRGAPSYNLAYLESTKLVLEGNRAVFDGAGIEWMEECAFEIVVYDGFAFVDYLDERWDCGFGMGAGVSGAYLLADPA